MTKAQAIKLLARRYTAKGMVDFGTPEDTLIATVLSARTRDEQVIRVYPGLRKAFPALRDLANASPEMIQKHIFTVGFSHAKARYLQALANQLLVDHEGKVPYTMGELTALPGVGRKTASCVLGYAFKLPAIAVDTHVLRIVRRLGWTSGRTPEQVEEELKALIPKNLWREVNRVFVQFGRDMCRPGKPQCWRCPLVAMCAYRSKTKLPKMLS